MATNDFNAQYLRQILNYDETTGFFTWAKPRPKIIVGCIAGTSCKKGYIVIKIDGKSHKAHRLAWLYVTGNHPSEQIDHKNRIKSDNRFDNLREANTETNCQNQGIRKNNTSGFQGVHKQKQNNKWCASISVGMKRLHLGYFESAEEAGVVYLEAKKTYHKNDPSSN